MRMRRIALALVASLLLAALCSGVSAADTSGDLKAAKDRLATLQSELTRLAGEWSAAQTRLAVTQSKLADTRARVDRLRSHLADIQDRIGMTARIAYESGGTGALSSLLSSGSFTEFSERMEFMDRITAADADLVGAARVTREDLRRDQQALTALSAQQARVVTELQSQKNAIDARLSEVATLVDKLRRQLAAESRYHGPPPPGGLPLQACPAPGSSFSDDFGAPRGGGRTHQGIDMLAPFGTPIRAAQSGRFQQDYNGLGGISALVYSGGGDYTYYAHMRGYAGVGNGATVSAGTVIGYVGNTGDASGGPPHLHFEYHPGGGGAVDPYSYLVALC
jgi:murein DD-endopeptidase MepM/ murein hydrolase activator NlpD